LNKKLLIIPAIAIGVAISGAALWPTGIAKANGNGNGDMMTQQLAQKLGIDQDKVSGAMDQIHEEKQARMQDEQKTKLQEAVDAGTITSEQKDAILTRQTEQQQKREQERTENQKWLSDNNLDRETLRDLGVGMGGHGRKGMGMGFGQE